MQGVDCFDYNKLLNVLVTGSADHVVRLWNPYVTSRPVAILQGHTMAIVDVKIHEDTAQVFSYSRDMVVNIDITFNSFHIVLILFSTLIFEQLLRVTRLSEMFKQCAGSAECR